MHGTFYKAEDKHGLWRRFWKAWVLFGYRRWAKAEAQKPVGVPGNRDPQAPCHAYSPRPAELRDWRDCEGDGHYLCEECAHFKAPEPPLWECSCTKVCDCQNYPRLQSEECPVHNYNPKPALDCPIHGEPPIIEPSSGGDISHRGVPADRRTLELLRSLKAQYPDTPLQARNSSIEPEQALGPVPCGARHPLVGPCVKTGNGWCWDNRHSGVTGEGLNAYVAHWIEDQLGRGQELGERHGHRGPRGGGPA